MEAMYGEARAKMETVLGVDGLKRELKELPLPDQRLVPDLRGRDPDEGFSAVPYVKGQWFLLFLERRFGREVFDIFLRGYFDHFAFKSVTTADFLEYLDTHLLKTNPGRVTRAEIDEWLFQPGVPKNAPEQVSDRFAKVGAARDAFLQGAAPKSLKTADWSAHEWLHFLNTQPTKLKKSQLKALDQAFGFTRSSNAEIAHAWLMIAVRNGYRDADAALDQYLLTIGRRKLVVPLYEALLKMPERRAHALEIFAQAKLSYHPLTVSTVEALIVPSAAPKP